ncbi:efflux RND transporter permease subunit [Ferruginibacter sp. HRS2-29]|uniref:efflux RND transporter permease subunit n=1 Tax=Ferruginibacter sp. HRS2-29 TaxID=2487334 RepID=UPI0020CCDB9F|nr:CusA/CzcA family heavy metal efflux RND transporter [Ferruginibacter sp. HRS2-29]MCP9750822.1 efflux RND transporter permease subunit [Ferruginibacter sp. HRS2-29]
MNKFISGIVTFSLKNRFFIFFMTLLTIIAGVWSYVKTPLEAFPDVTNTQIIIVTQWNGRSAEEVERFVTTPIEVAMNSVQKKSSLRSISMFGLSVTKLIFDDGVEDFFARQQVTNLLQGISLPEGVEPEVQPPYGPTGEIFRYTLQSKTKNSIDLNTIQNWVIDRRIRSIPGVADLNVFGGAERTYEITADPVMLAKYDITPLEIYTAVSRSNINVGGDVIEKNGQAYVVRGIGLLDNIRDIENIIVDNINGTPILVKNVATVSPSNKPRVGQAGLNDNSDVVEGIIVMRKGENPREVLKLVKEKIKDLNERILPDDVKIVPFYDRDNLMDFCTDTIRHNLLEGILLVTVIVFLFMWDWRTTLIVSIIIPLALLFAFICLKMKGMTANLLSMGAIDFGIIIDGAVVMVEGLFVVLAHKAHEMGMEKYNKTAKLSTIRKTGSSLAKAIFFAKIIIITSLIPIFAFEKVEGKMFSPLAWTLSFALLGALIFTLTLVPVLTSILLRKNVKEKNNPIVNFFDKIVKAGLSFTMKNAKLSMIVAFTAMAITFFSFKFLGTEFLPQLNEGSLWVTTEFPMSTSLTQAKEQTDIFRKGLMKFPEVKNVLSQIGRSNDGTDPNGFYFVQYQVDLKEKKDWKRKISQDELIAEMAKQLNQYPGIVLNFSQPIIDNVAEAVAGFKASLAVKIYGSDLEKLEKAADSVCKVMKNVEGITDLGVLRNIGQPELSIVLDEGKMATYGVTTADANSLVEMAIGGKTASTFYQEERKFDIRIRYPEQYRNNEEAIGALLVPTMHGSKIPLREIATVKTVTGPAFVYRDKNMRFIAIKFSIRGRDMGSTIVEAQEKVSSQIKLGKGFNIEWAGEFENQQRAQSKLAQVVPIVLVLIFILLFISFGNGVDAGLVLLNVPFAIMGGILALHITGTIFSISAGIGFIALFGICIQNGVILVSVFKQNLHKKIPLVQAIKEGVQSRVRPVVMTALMAAIGLMPAALSTGIGSETQKPLAIVVIGGLISSTILTLLIFPLIVELFYKRTHSKKIKRKVSLT